jgi:hypothetical protein
VRCVCLSQASRGLADSYFYVFIVLQLVHLAPTASDAAWKQLAALLIAPVLLLVPITGAITNSLPRRWVLTGSAACCLCMPVLVGLGAQMGYECWAWRLGLALAALGTAVYSTTCRALLPAAARDSRLPLPRVNGWVNASHVGAIIIGVVLAANWHSLFLPAARVALGGSEEEFGPWGVPMAAALATSFNLIGLLTTLPVYFPSDSYKPNSPRQAIADFFRDKRSVWLDSQACGSLLAMAGWVGLVGIGAGVSIFRTGGHGRILGEGLLRNVVLAGMGLVAGSLVASVQSHPRRSLGLLPVAATGLAVVLLCAACSPDSTWPCFSIGLMGGLALSPLQATYQASLAPEARGNAMAM